MLALVLLVTWVLPLPAPDAASGALGTAEAAYRARHYEQVLPAVTTALATPLSRAQQTRAYELRALAYSAFDESSEAISAFESLLRVDAEYVPRNVSPKVAGLYEEARRRVPFPKRKVVPPAALAPLPPARPPATPLVKRWWFWTAAGVVTFGAGTVLYAETRPHLRAADLGTGELR